MTNCRPVSLFFFILFAKALCSRLKQHMCTGCYVILASDGIIKWHAKHHVNTNNLLVPEECGLRTGMSTSDTVIELTHRILKSFNKKKASSW